MRKGLAKALATPEQLEAHHAAAHDCFPAWAGTDSIGDGEATQSASSVVVDIDHAVQFHDL